MSATVSTIKVTQLTSRSAGPGRPRGCAVRRVSRVRGLPSSEQVGRSGAAGGGRPGGPRLGRTRAVGRETGTVGRAGDMAGVRAVGGGRGASGLLARVVFALPLAEDALDLVDGVLDMCL